MIEEKLARIRAYRNNIDRYRWLLRTQISEQERQYIERRLSEEESGLQALVPSGAISLGSDGA